jgi:SAM-dependent methyltransferase
VSATAPDTTFDLAALRPRPDLGASVWRHPALAIRFYAPAAEFAKTAMKGRPRVLDVGCGFGTIALELARAGHEVTALDVSEEACATARRTLAGTSAEVICAAFGEDRLHEGSFDAVRFGRSLHHLDVEAAAERAALLLGKGGVVVLDEFCAERVDRVTATWLASLVQSLSGVGAVSETGLEDADAIVKLWETQRRTHHLATGEEMWRALEARFVLDEPRWYPYLWLEAAKFVADPVRAELVGGTYEAQEGALIRNGTLPGVAFRSSGTAR